MSYPSGRFAGVSLLLLLFGEQFENSLPDRFIGHSLQKVMVAIDILASDKPIHGALPSSARRAEQRAEDEGGCRYATSQVLLFG